MTTYKGIPLVVMNQFTPMSVMPLVTREDSFTLVSKRDTENRIATLTEVTHQALMQLCYENGHNASECALGIITEMHGAHMVTVSVCAFLKSTQV